MGDNNEVASLFTRNHPSMIPGAMRPSAANATKKLWRPRSSWACPPTTWFFWATPTAARWTFGRNIGGKFPVSLPLTRANAVPYQQALTPGSAHAGEDILDDLEEVICDFQPTHIAVSHPADHNVDHRALYLFTRVVLWNLAEEGFAPQLLVYPAHFTQWPQPRG